MKRMLEEQQQEEEEEESEGLFVTDTVGDQNPQLPDFIPFSRFNSGLDIDNNDSSDSGDSELYDSDSWFRRYHGK